MQWGLGLSLNGYLYGGLDSLVALDSAFVLAYGLDLAGLAVGFWESVDEVKKQWRSDRVFTPEMDEKSVKAAKTGWADAISRTLTKKLF